MRTYGYGIALVLVVALVHTGATGALLTVTNNNSNDAGDVYPLSLGDQNTGELVNIDRTHTFGTLPAYMQNIDYVMTANDDKTAGGTFSIDLTFDANTRLYLSIDDRINLGSKMAWVGTQGWTDTGDNWVKAQDASYPFSVYTLDVAGMSHTFYEQNDGGSRNMYSISGASAGPPPPPPPPGPTSPVDALADLNRLGTGNTGLNQGSVQWTIDPSGFPGGDVDLGEDPNDLGGPGIAYWYIKPSSQGGSGALPPKSLYYDLGQPMTVDQIHLWWQNRDNQTGTTGLPTNMDIDYIAMSGTQPGAFDLATMQAVTNWTTAVGGHVPTLDMSGQEQTQDVPDFTAQYLRLEMNSAYLPGGTQQWGGLRQIAITEATANVIPEPMTMLALGLGLSSLGGYMRRRRRA